MGGTPIQIRDYLEENVHVSLLRNWDEAFKDAKNWIFDDIPEEFVGSKQLQLNMMFEKEELEFSVNQKVSIFIAFPENKSNPLPEDFEVTR
jgi:hypothetical protein